MSEWQETNLGKYLKLKGGYSFKSSDFKDAGDVPVIKIGNVTGGGKVNLSGVQFVSKEIADQAKAFHTKAGDVLISMTGANVGKVARTSGCDPVCVINQRVGKFELNKDCPYSLDFIYYIVTSSQAYEFFSKTAYGSAQPNISGGLIESFKFNELDPDDANRGAELLKSIDDKIEVNQRMNETLEAMARALFKSWFVDFDPVRAKAEGRKPEGMDAATAALFPATFNDDGLPEGWERETFGSIAENAGTTVQPSQTSPDTPYIGLEHMPRRCIALSEWEGAGKVTSNKFAFLRGDFLFGKLRPYFHKVGIAAIDGISSTDILIIRPKREEFYAFVLSVISSTEFVGYTDKSSQGTKMPRTNWKDMARYELVLPDKVVALAYNKAVKPMLEQIIANVHENRTLAALRDALLPKLISGELRIDDAVPVRKGAAG